MRLYVGILSCVCNFIVCIVYSCVPYFSCAVATVSRGALLFLAYLCTVFDHFCRFVFRSLAPVAFCRLRPCACFHVHVYILCCTFCRTFCLKRSTFIPCGFKRFFKRVICSCVYLHRLHRLSRLYSLICGQFAVLGVG